MYPNSEGTVASGGTARAKPQAGGLLSAGLGTEHSAGLLALGALGLIIVLRFAFRRGALGD